MEEVVTLQSDTHPTLYGIIHIPEEVGVGVPKRGVNLLNPGIKNRVAPHRLNVKIARRLCNEGYYVLRVDPTGIGDSQGELQSEQPILNVWESIQRGLFVPDVRTASRHLVSKFGIDRLFVIGSCGGAATALLASNESFVDVSGLVLIDLPITYSGEGKDQSLAERIKIGGSYADKQAISYINKLKRVESWVRLLTLRADFKAILAVISHGFKRRYNFMTRNDYEIKDLNHDLVLALNRYLSKGGKVLFIFGENDPTSQILRIKFLPKYLAINPGLAKQVSLVVIKDANHIYTLECWQETLFAAILDWFANFDEL